MIFNDKTVIITGASMGVGAATARLFADAGANLMLVARTRKKLEDIADELRDRTRVKVFAMDVSDADACVDLFKKAQVEFGHVDILVNNAGCHIRGSVEEVEPGDLAQMVDVNLRAPIMLCRLALPYLREAGGGAIINVGSLAGRTPVPGLTTYASTKAGLRAFTRALAAEVVGGKIKVALVSPGPVDTGFIMDDVDAVSDITFSQPMSTAEDVARTILDLCGNAKLEQTMPPISGFLTTLTNLAPWINRVLRPTLEKKGQRVKKQIKAEKKRRAAGDNA